MTWRLVAEQEFNEAIKEFLKDDEFSCIGCVTGPGRSGAIAAVYASHILKVPFIPYGTKKPVNLGRLLIIDTATDSGKTLREAGKKYEDSLPLVRAVYKESVTDKPYFWYEECNPKPHRFKPKDFDLIDDNSDISHLFTLGKANAPAEDWKD